MSRFRPFIVAVFAACLACAAAVAQGPQPPRISPAAHAAAVRARVIQLTGVAPPLRTAPAPRRVAPAVVRAPAPKPVPLPTADVRKLQLPADLFVKKTHRHLGGGYRGPGDVAPMPRRW